MNSLHVNMDNQSLLTTNERLRSNNYYLSILNTTRWKKNILLLVILVFIGLCLTVYLYLNMEAIDENQSDSSTKYKPLSRRKPMLDHESIFSDSGPSMIKLSDLLAHCIVALQIAGKEVVNLSLSNNNKLSHVGSKGKTLEGVDDVVTGADMKSHHMIINTIKDSYRRLKVVSEEDTTKDFEIVNPEEDLLPIERTEFAKLLRNNLHDIEIEHADRGSLIAQHETIVWIDPLDATKEYSENLTSYVTLMACIVYKSIPIAGVIFKPFTNETFWSMMEEPTGKSHHSPDLNRIMGEVGNLHNSKINDNIRIIVSRSHAGNVRNVLNRIYGDKAQIISAGGSGYKTIELIRGNVDAYMHLTHIKKWDICAPNAILNSMSNGKLTNLKGDKITYGDPKDKLVTGGLLATLNHKTHEELASLTKTMINLTN